MFDLTRDAIDIQKIIESVQKPEDGAVVVFDGVVRNHSKGKAVRYLEYDAYETMAIRKLEEVGAHEQSHAQVPGDPGQADTGQQVTGQVARQQHQAGHQGDMRPRRVSQGEAADPSHQYQRSHGDG